jgi:hypothetical protein
LKDAKRFGIVNKLDNLTKGLLVKKKRKCIGKKQDSGGSMIAGGKNKNKK